MPDCRRLPHRLAVMLAAAMILSLAVPACSRDSEAPEAAPTDSPAPPEPPAPAVEPPPAGELTAALRTMAADQRVSGTRFAVCVIDPATGDELLAANADAPLIPASNAKLATSAASLAALGPEWRFRTFIGTLGDDLVVIGGGDPNLSDRFYDADTTAVFRRWATLLKSRGVTAVKGRLVFDDSLFEPAWVHPDWPAADRERYYAAPIGALMANDSCVNLYARGADQAGRPAQVWLDPPTRYFQVSGHVETRAARNAGFWADLRRDPPRLILRGDIPPKYPATVYWRPVDDPGLFAATVIKETLQAQGIAIAGPVVRRRLWTDAWRMPEDFRCHVIHSSSLAQTLRVANTRSTNPYAECLMKALAAYRGSDDRRWPSAPGTWTAGSRAVAETLKALGVATEGCVFADGCGLSRRNRLTARALAQLLAAMARRDDAELWISTLAAYGDSVGTLRSYPRDPLLNGRVFAKTGQLSNVRSLSGYVRTQSGRLLVVSMLVNDIRGPHWPVKQWMYEMLRLLARS